MPTHLPGNVLADMAVAIADGATSISDLAALRDQLAKGAGFVCWVGRPGVSEHRTEPRRAVSFGWPQILDPADRWM
jgi:hypothetical protein